MTLCIFYSLLVNEPKAVYSYKRKYEYLAKKYHYVEQLLEANVVKEFVSQSFRTMLCKNLYHKT
jgi:hypothetical protein